MAFSKASRLDLLPGGVSKKKKLNQSVGYLAQKKKKGQYGGNFLPTDRVNF
jgi:hypothetical protein